MKFYILREKSTGKTIEAFFTKVQAETWIIRYDWNPEDFEIRDLDYAINRETVRRLLALVDLYV